MLSQPVQLQVGYFHAGDTLNRKFPPHPPATLPPCPLPTQIMHNVTRYSAVESNGTLVTQQWRARLRAPPNCGGFFAVASLRAAMLQLLKYCAAHTKEASKTLECFLSSFHTCIPYRGVLACVVEQYGRPSRVLGEPLRHIVDFPVQNDPAVLELFVLSDFLAREARKLRRRRNHPRARHSRNRKGILSNAKNR